MEYDLKKIRETYKLNQQEFADELGITREMVGQMERGQKGVSKATKVLIREFFNRKNVPSHSSNINDSVPPLQTDQTKQILAMDIPDGAKIGLLVELVALKEREYALLEKITNALQAKLEQLKGEKVS